jgi:hypothetical protein
MNAEKKTTKTVKLIAYLCIFGLLCGLLIFADCVLMNTRYSRYQRLLKDIDHRPKQDAIEFNSDGIRDSREASDFPASDFNIIFLGDSFVYGLYLYPHEALPQLFEKQVRGSYPERKINVANFAWISASPYLSLRQLEQIGPKYNPDLVILCIDMTDFNDDIKYEFYNEKPGIYRLLSVMPSVVFILKDISVALDIHENFFGYPIEVFFVMDHPLEESRQYMKYIQKNIDKIEGYVSSELNAKFLLVILPRHFQYSMDECPKEMRRKNHKYTRMGPNVQEPFRYFEEIKEIVDYPVYSLQPDFQNSGVFPTTFFKDQHWTSAGTRVAMDAILRIVQEEGLL